MNSKIPQDWKIWAEENIHNGSDPEELIDEMIKAGFDESLSKKFIFSIKIDKDAIEIGRLRYRDFENKSFKPIKGMALVWNNLNYDDMPNTNTIHQGKPVLRGHKSIITKWFREKRSGST